MKFFTYQKRTFLFDKCLFSAPGLTLGSGSPIQIDTINFVLSFSIKIGIKKINK